MSNNNPPAPPPSRPKPASNNPFLDDIEQEMGSSMQPRRPAAPRGRLSHSGTENSSSYGGSAAEEKERMRKAYAEQDAAASAGTAAYGSNAGLGAVDDLPPSYEEVARDSHYRREHLPEKGPQAAGAHPSRRPHRSGGSSSHRKNEAAGEKRSTSLPRRKGKSPRKGSSSNTGGAAAGSGSRKNASGSGANGSSGPMPKNVDTIDKLDVTGLFGGAFHHDGPFDACTPHRNLNKKVAPVLAFPKNGPNSTLTGASVNKSAMNEVFGIDDEDDDSYLYNSKGTSNMRSGSGAAGPGSRKNRSHDDDDYVIGMMGDDDGGGGPRRRRDLGIAGNNDSSSTLDAIKQHTEVTQFDAKKTETVHGPTTQGLGSTTFLDGAPAAPAAIEEQMQKQQSSLARKKSLSHRLAANKNNTNGSLHQGSPYDAQRNGRPKKSYEDDIPDNYRHPSATGFSPGAADEEDDNCLSFSDSGPQKKESSGNKFLRRVKSLKVSRR